MIKALCKSGDTLLGIKRIKFKLIIVFFELYATLFYCTVVKHASARFVRPDINMGAFLSYKQNNGHARVNIRFRKRGKHALKTIS